MITRLQASMLFLAALAATLMATGCAGPQRAPDGKGKLGPAIEKPCDILIVDGEPGDGKGKLGPAIEKPCDILIVDGEPADQEFESESYFLKMLFDIHVRGQAPLSTTVVNNQLPARFTSKLVILANVGDVGAAGTALLEDHVKRGGGLLIFCGDRVNIAGYNTLLHKKGKGLLPARLDKKIVAKKDEAAKPLHFDPTTWTIGADNLFAEEEGWLLKRAVVTGHITVAPEKLAKTELKYDNGHAAVLSKAFGKGRSVLVTTACDREWGNLPVSTPYVVFVFEILESFGIGEEQQPGANRER